MPKEDRGMIKWMPFNSVTSSSEMVRSILKEKSKIKMPILSEEQKNNIEKYLILKFYAGEKIGLSYFYQGKILTINGYIKKIDSTFHKIYLDNHVLFFDQIVKVQNAF